MKHMKAEAWTYHEMTPERTAAWFKQQSDDQIAVLKAHNVWYGPEHLRPAPEPEPEPEPDIHPGMSLAERLIVLCARWQGINAMAIRAKFRGVRAVNARQLAAWLIRQHCKDDDGEQLPSQAIGKMLGGRDRTTIVHSLKVVNGDLAAGGGRFGAIVEHIETELGLR